MAIIKCPECGKEISDTCKRCPQCGYKLAKKMSAKAISVILVGTVVVAIIGATAFYKYSHIKVNTAEMAVIAAIKDIKSNVFACLRTLFEKGDKRYEDKRKF